MSNPQNTKPGTASGRVIFLAIVFVVTLLVLILVDGFLLYPIAPGENTFALDNPALDQFELSHANAPYADAEILDSDTAAREVKIYIVRQDGQLHLLDFRIHFLTKRIALKHDVILDENQKADFTFGHLWWRVPVSVDHGRLTQVDTRNSGETTFAEAMTAYAAVALGITAVVALVSKLLTRKKKA